jgi:hypothetical protein
VWIGSAGCGRAPRSANGLLIVSSLGIDLLGCFVLVYSVLGPSVRSFAGLLMLYLLRQVCQALCALPPPKGMIWWSPGVPSWLVTYGTANDLFFSGHTALAVFDSIELTRWGDRRGLLSAGHAPCSRSQRCWCCAPITRWTCSPAR